MALTAEQTKGLQDQFKQFRSQGLDATAATAKLKEAMKTAGVYDNAKALYNASAAAPVPVVPNASVPPLPTPAAPRGQAPKVDGTPVNPAPVTAPAPVTVNTSVPATPATLNATAGQTDATGMIVPQGMTSFDTSAGKNLSQFQQPVQQVQPVQAPAPAKPATVSTDKAQEIDRSREIMANLQEGQKNYPQLFKDEATFKQAYGYDTKPVEEQAQLDAFWKAQNKRSADQLIDMALARQDLSAYKGTPEFLTAQRVGKAVLDYSKMTPALLAQRMEAMESDLLPGSKAYDVLSKANPQLVAEAERIKDANRRSGIIGYDADGKATTNRIPDAETNISDSLTNGVSETAIPSLASALNTHEITKAREAASATKTQLNELYDTVEGIEDDVRAELKGTGATESYIRALINERSKPILKQVNSLERKYANEAGDLKALSDAATDGFKYSWQLASEDRQMAREKGLLAYKKTLESDGNATDLVDLGGKKVLIEKGTGKVIETFDVTRPLTDQFEFRTEKVGNSEVTAIYSKTTGKLISRSEAPSGSGGVVFDKDQADLRKEFNALPDVKGFSEVSTAYEKVAKAAELANKDPKNAAADIAMIFGYMKLLDPTSVVREGEFATAQNAGSIPTTIQNAYNKALNGQFQTPKQRSDIVSNSQQVYSTYKDRYDARKSEYEGYGMKLGFVQPTSTQVSENKPSSQNFRVVGTTTDNANQLNTLKKTNPLDAGPKYNNLGGISFRGANGKEFGFNETLRKAGIPFSEGGVRGVGGKEGGTYVKFPSVGDGVDAYNLLWKTNSYQGMKVSDAMNKWGTGSVGLPKEMLSKKVSEIDKATLSKIKALQISKESPAMFQYLKDNGLLKNL
jgi:hypothetical protein